MSIYHIKGNLVAFIESLEPGCVDAGMMHKDIRAITDLVEK